MMEVQFCRTGERRYSITIIRKDHPPIEMNPAPGYDPIMPHDLLHFVVESELGLSRGIFGQIAVGGNAGTFHTVHLETGHRREAARLRRRAARRGEKLLREGRRESALSERATYISLYEWLSRSDDPDRKKLAAQMTSQAKQRQDHELMEDGPLLSEAQIDRICARLDELSSRWMGLDIGESFSVFWPERK
jgi:hypothetical protein